MQPSKYIQLTPWQQKQASMLSYFSSLDYLVSLHRLVSDLLNKSVDPVLDLAKSQNRDSVLVDPRWGDRNTSQNWSNHAWAYLKDLQLSLAKDVAQRTAGIYRMSGVSSYFRGMDQFSLDWMTHDEERDFEDARQQISDWARPLDLTLADDMSNQWKDFTFAYYYPIFSSQFSYVPRFRVRADIVYPTGAIPNETGVYVSKDDPNASLQFAWAGKEGRKLRKATTFNDIGLAALANVGRDDLWFNDQKMFDFATSPQFIQLFREGVIWNDGPHPDLAAPVVSSKAFTKKDSEWYLVEPIEGQFDRLCDLESLEQDQTIDAGPRIEGGEECSKPGFYFSPARPNSRRYLAAGEIAPALDTEYGRTFWQWDPNQE
jgi:hypothetical protein